MKKIIIITGPIGSGKTLACKLLKKYGYRYINSDKLAKEMIRNDKNIKQNIFKLLDIGNLSRNVPWKKIRNFIATSINNKKIYDSIIHNAFYKKLNQIIQDNQYSYVIEIPLVETIKNIKQKKITICILANYRNRKDRFIKNKHKNELQFDNLNKLQKSQKFYMKNSDYVIYNNKEIEIMNNKLVAIMNKYQ